MANRDGSVPLFRAAALASGPDTSAFQYRSELSQPFTPIPEEKLLQFSFVLKSEHGSMLVFAGPVSCDALHKNRVLGIAFSVAANTHPRS